MSNVFSIFFRTPGTRPSVVLLCLIIAGLAEAVSYGTLVPLLALLADADSSPETSTFSTLLHNAFQHLDIDPGIGVLVAFIVTSLVIKAAVSFIALSYAAYSKTRLIGKLREDLIGGLISTRWSHHSDQRLGAVASTIASDTNYAGDAYLSSARFVAGLIQTVSYLCVALLISWQVTLFGLALGAFMFVTLRTFVNATRISGRQQQARTAGLVALLVDTLSNIKPLKAMDRKSQWQSLLSKKNRRVQKAMLRRELTKIGLMNAQDIIAATAFGFGLYVAATSWNTPLPILLGVAVLLLKLNGSFAKTHNLLVHAAENQGAYLRSFDLVDKANAVAEEDEGTEKPPANAVITFEKVSFGHGSRAVITDVSIDIPPNSITVIQGASGTGKTTLIDLLTCLYRPSTGRILVGDTDLTRISLKAWRRTIGYVQQELTLLHSSIADNITLGDETISDDDIWRAIDLAGARDFIEDLPAGLTTDAGEMGTRLSGGQRQRIALARALVGKPRLLILDEVTSALDPQTEREICERIQGLSDRFTVIAVTHRSAWTTIATRLYKIADGRVIVCEVADHSREATGRKAGSSKARQLMA